MQTRRTAAAFGLVLIIGGAAAVRAGVDPATRPVGADQATTVAAYNRLAFGLYAQLRSSDAGSEPANLLLSSHSVADALAMLYEGARGRTADEIRAALPIPAERERRHRAARELAEFLQDQSPDAQATRKRRAAEAERHGDAAPDEDPDWRSVSFGAALWARPGLEPDPALVDALAKSYGAVLEPLDVRASAARDKVNRWAAGQTHGRVTDLLAPSDLDKSTGALLVTTAYFKAHWQHAFEKDDTKDADFHVTPQRSVRVPLMHQVRMLPYYKDADVQLVSLDYATGPAYDRGAYYSMVLLLPGDGKSLADLEAIWTPGHVDKWLAATHVTKQQLEQWEKGIPESMKDPLVAERVLGELLAGTLKDPAVLKWIATSPEKMVTVEVPRFRIEARSDLSPALAALGIKSAFSLAAADLSGFGRGMTSVGRVSHAAMITVDEHGTEAAAATAAGGLFGGGFPAGAPVVFRADRPFLFLIREEKTGAILYLGRMTHPQDPHRS